jgi:hypothetical protein
MFASPGLTWESSKYTNNTSAAGPAKPAGSKSTDGVLITQPEQ